MSRLLTASELSASDDAFIDGWFGEVKMLPATSQIAQALNEMKTFQSEKARMGWMEPQEIAPYINILPLNRRLIFRDAYQSLSSKLKEEHSRSSSSSSSSFQPVSQFMSEWNAFCSAHSSVDFELQNAMNEDAKQEFLSSDETKRTDMVIVVDNKRKRDEEEETDRKKVKLNQIAGENGPNISCLNMMKGLPRVIQTQFISHDDSSVQHKLVFPHALQHLVIGTDLYIRPSYVTLANSLLSNTGVNPIQAVAGNCGIGKSSMIPYLIDLFARGRAGLRGKGITTFDLLVLYSNNWYYLVDVSEKGEEKINYAVNAPEFKVAIPVLEGDSFDPKARVTAHRSINCNMENAILFYDCGKLDTPGPADILPRTILFTSSNQERLQRLTMPLPDESYLPVCSLEEILNWCVMTGRLSQDECETRYDIIGGNLRLISQMDAADLRTVVLEMINSCKENILDAWPGGHFIHNGYNARTLLHYQVDPATFKVVGIDYASIHIAQKVEEKCCRYSRRDLVQQMDDIIGISTWEAASGFKFLMMSALLIHSGGRFQIRSLEPASTVVTRQFPARIVYEQPGNSVPDRIRIFPMERRLLSSESTTFDTAVTGTDNFLYTENNLHDNFPTVDGIHRNVAFQFPQRQLNGVKLSVIARMKTALDTAAASTGVAANPIQLIFVVGDPRRFTGFVKQPYVNCPASSTFTAAETTTLNNLQAANTSTAGVPQTTIQQWVALVDPQLIFPPSRQIMQEL